MESIFIFGASGHCKVILDVVEQEGLVSVAGLVDDRLAVGAEHFGYPVLGSTDALAALCAEHKVSRGIVAIGDNFVRARVVRRIAELMPEFGFATAAHPSAQVARGAVFGPGTVLMPGAVLGSDCTVGAHCIMNTCAHLDHDGVMESYASLAPGVAAGGNCRIGPFAAVGIGASLAHGRTVGEHAVVGAGAVVLGDVPDREVWYGVPARFVRGRAPGDDYL